MFRSKRSRILPTLGVMAVAVAGLPGSAVGHDKHHDDELDVEVIASGLDNPRGLTLGPHDSLYVAEAGIGGTGPCFAGPEGPACYGESGAVTRIDDDGDQERVLTGLPSFGAEGTGDAAIGPSDVAFKHHKMYVTVGLGLDLDFSSTIPELDDMGELVKASRWRDGWRTVADLAEFEDEANPTGDEENVNPNALLATRRGLVVADAGANDLLKVKRNGDIDVLATFPNVMVPAPPELGMPPGTEIPMDAVPTSVTRGPDGALYVGQLTGFPFPVGGAKVFRVRPGHEPEVYAEGFTNIIDLAFDEDGRLYVLEIYKNGLLSGDPTGALIKVGKRGRQHEVMSEGLHTPGGLLIDDDEAYVSNCGTCAGTGEVLEIELD